MLRTRLEVARFTLLAAVALVVALGTDTARATTPFVNQIADGSANSVGLYTSLALDVQGNPYVSCYDNTNGNLLYVRKASGLWTTETVDGSANDLGWYSSLALDALGNPHVSYYDNTIFDLKYSRKSGGVWIRETADGSPNDVGEYNSLALDVQGNVHVSYRDFDNGDLKYARKAGGAWTIEMVDGVANNVGRYGSLALDAQGNPHVTYYDVTNGDLKYARKAGGAWTIETADGSANNVGLYTSLAVDAQGNPYVSYRDLTNGDLKFARKSSGTWTTEIADGQTTNVGEYTSLALDPDGNPHVSYYDLSFTDLKFARKFSGVWTVETLEASANNLGAHSSLVLDAQGNPHVSYWDQTAGDLKYADAAVHVVAPVGGVAWAVGSLQNIRWSGIGPVTVSLSLDGGRTFDALRAGLKDNVWALRVPHAPSRFARLRIERASPLSTAESDSFFTIDATITLAKFEATRSDEGTQLKWETRPGPEADIRYRVERGSDGAYVPIADALDRGEFVDPSLIASSRYRLIAINGLGEEYVLGETSVAGALAIGRDLSIQPNPARDGSATFTFRAPLDPVVGDAAAARIEVAMFDLSGRRIVTLADGQRASGVHSTRWDGRDEAGRDVAAGIYFARLSWNGAPRATERVTVVR